MAQRLDLLRALLSEHLDPGYAAAAQRRQAGPQSGRPGQLIWQALAALLIAVVFAAASAQARSTASGVTAARTVLTDSVRATDDRVDRLAGRRTALAAQADEVQRRELATDSAGRALLADLDAAALSGATTPVSGPGLLITLSDPVGGPDLTDVSKQRVPGSRQVILDRDLQQAVNSLWANGAEAVSVGGVRIGPGVTVRQAGGAILVDNQPVVSPYVVLAVGAPETLARGFGDSGGLRRLRLLEKAYGAGVTVSIADSVSLPAAAARNVTFARRANP